MVETNSQSEDAPYLKHVSAASNLTGLCNSRDLLSSRDSIGSFNFSRGSSFEKQPAEIQIDVEQYSSDYAGSSTQDSFDESPNSKRKRPELRILINRRDSAGTPKRKPQQFVAPIPPLLKTQNTDAVSKGTSEPTLDEVLYPNKEEEEHEASDEDFWEFLYFLKQMGTSSLGNAISRIVGFFKSETAFWIFWWAAAVFSHFFKGLQPTVNRNLSFKTEIGDTIVLPGFTWLAINNAIVITVMSPYILFKIIKQIRNYVQIRKQTNTSLLQLVANDSTPIFKSWRFYFFCLAIVLKSGGEIYAGAFTKPVIVQTILLFSPFITGILAMFVFRLESFQLKLLISFIIGFCGGVMTVFGHASAPEDFTWLPNLSDAFNNMTWKDGLGISAAIISCISMALFATILQQIMKKKEDTHDRNFEPDTIFIFEKLLCLVVFTLLGVSTEFSLWQSFFSQLSVSNIPTIILNTLLIQLGSELLLFFCISQMGAANYSLLYPVRLLSTLFFSAVFFGVIVNNLVEVIGILLLAISLGEYFVWKQLEKMMHHKHEAQQQSIQDSNSIPQQQRQQEDDVAQQAEFLFH